MNMLLGMMDISSPDSLNDSDIFVLKDQASIENMIFVDPVEEGLVREFPRWQGGLMVNSYLKSWIYKYQIRVCLQLWWTSGSWPLTKKHVYEHELDMIRYRCQHGIVLKKDKYFGDN